ncbi:NDP-sugar pyrophosphorylase family protein [Shimia isoporae]|uniref:NDP-sugar pyrophosphorylase family protein n=1 Tax=Shimia isoporae TaxID=647720 RepID=A0A4R1NAK5_9RHOB|nr:sugar phosphate nucleotidyltransferase [Shimia isoporae]TCL01139.1 NDP-sugar pyrophosphorylase family protein [Shimia isoporae]
MLTNCEDVGFVSIVKLASNRLTAADLAPLKIAVEREVDRGRNTILFDLGGIRRVTRSGLAALIELQSEVTIDVKLGFFGARPHVAGEIRRCPLSSLLSYQDTREQALDVPHVRARRLAGMKAVVLCAGAGTRMRPLSLETPKPMLDIAGKPALERILEHLGRFGIRDFILNPGHGAPAIHGAFATTAQRSIQFANEGAYVEGHWQPSPVGSASTLARLQLRQNAFDDDFLVLCGDAVSDVDVCELVNLHRAKNADVTIAALRVAREEVGKYGVLVTDEDGRVREFCEKPAPEDAQSTLISSGIYVINPRVLIGLSEAVGIDIGCDLLPRILARGGKLQAYEGVFSWADLGNTQDYFKSLERVMRGEIQGAVPEGALNRNGVWIAPTANVSDRAVVIGPCYIGPGAKVEAGAHIEGPAVIGTDSHITTRTVVKRAIIQPRTQVCPGTWVNGMIVSKDWALDLDANSDLPPAIEALDGIVAAKEQEVDISTADRLMQELMG